jgi:sulfate adenylyltransferase large subunit
MLSASTTKIEQHEEFENFLERDLNKELLRFTTAGSVDDGKSTLIGRLLHDSKAVYEDQLASVRKSRINRSGRAIDFSLLTDGLRAEREQGITIDVAYRYFSTSRRKFIIADTPGHEQYTRNMATGASTADLAIILVDATKGLLPQTRRHAYIAALLGIPHALAAVNKMDLVGYREDVFLSIERDFSQLAKSLGIPFVQCIPISALEGDNVVTRSESMSWYSGLTLMEHLETVEIHPQKKFNDVRFPIQYVIRPDASFRGFAGRVASGVLHPGDSVLALPSKQRTKVQAIVSYDGELEAAIPSQSVVLKLEDEIDLSRGDMLVSLDAPPVASGRFAAMVVWLHAQPLELNRTYLVKHTGRQVRAKATRIRFRVNINDLTEHSADQLEMNEIASLEFETSSPLFFDSYERNRATGSFILIDPLSNTTVGAAMIREELAQEEGGSPGKHAPIEVSRGRGVTLGDRSERHKHLPAIFSIAGSRAVAELVEKTLFEKGFEALLLRQEQAPLSALPAILSALWSAGFLVVYWAEALSRQEHAALEEVAGGFFFNLSEAASASPDHEILPRALAIAETLRRGTDRREKGVQ